MRLFSIKFFKQLWQPHRLNHRLQWKTYEYSNLTSGTLYKRESKETASFKVHKVLTCITYTVTVKVEYLEYFGTHIWEGACKTLWIFLANNTTFSLQLLLPPISWSAMSFVFFSGKKLFSPWIFLLGPS